MAGSFSSRARASKQRHLTGAMTPSSPAGMPARQNWLWGRAPAGPIFVPPGGFLPHWMGLEPLEQVGERHPENLGQDHQRL